LPWGHQSIIKMWLVALFKKHCCRCVS